MTASIAPLASKLTLNVSEFSSGVARAEADATRLAKKLEAQQKSFGLKGNDLQISKLADKGIDPQQVARLKAANDQLEAMRSKIQARAAAEARAAQITQAALTPLERHKQLQSEVNALVAQGVLTQQVANKSIADSANAMEKAGRRGLTQFTRLLRGGGAGAIFHFVGQQLNQGLDKVAAVQRQVAEGSLSVNEGFVEGALVMTRTLPVAGQFFEAGEKIHSMLTGQAAAEAEVAAMNKRHADAMAVATQKSEEYHSALEAGTAALQRLKDEQAAATASTSGIGATDLLQTANAARAAQVEIDKLTTTIKSLAGSKDFTGETANLQELREKLKQAQAEIPAVARANIFGNLEQQLSGFGKSSADIDLIRLKMLGADDTTLKLAGSIVIATKTLNDLSVSGKSLSEINSNTATAKAAVQALADAGTISSDTFAAAMKKIDQSSLDAGLAVQESIGNTIDDLQTQVQEFGLTAGEKKLVDMEALGATPEQIAMAQHFIDKLDDLSAAKKKMDDLAQAGQQAFDSTRTPIEKYEAQIGKLSEALDAKKISWDTYGRAVQKARQELEKSTEVKPTAPVAFNVAGSAEAQRLAYSIAHPRTTTRDDLSKKQLDAQLLMTKSLATIAVNTKPIQQSNWDIT